VYTFCEFRRERRVSEEDDVRRIRDLLEKDAPGGETTSDEDPSLTRSASA